MNRRMTIFATLFLLLTSVAAIAHNGVEHVLGTITALTSSAITIETPKHTSITVTLTAATKFMKGTAAAAAKDAKVGDRVAIDAKEGADKKLTGLTVKIGAAGAATTPGDHK